ncbi:MAG: hypothetical protein JXR79_01010 [Nitrospirae bacterium]|nr:hypothetical protein [Nitrospirota bacterium]
MSQNSYPKYSPMYFLASLGNGGLSVAFFSYLMFMVPHEGRPMATFSDIYPSLTGGGLAVSLLIIIALAGILYFAYEHYRLLIWNFREYKRYKNDEAFAALKKSNDEVMLMAIPLTLAMSINVFFVIGAVFVPGLWNIVEYLFPFAMLGFLVVGIYAIRIFVGYYSRFIHHGNFDFDRNNNLSQTLGTFSFAMIAVGLAAPGAMSNNLSINAISSFFAIMFATFAILIGLIKLVIGMKSILRLGISTETSPSLWMFIPISTILGITGVRLLSGFYHNFLHESLHPVMFFMLISFLIGVQLFFGLVGWSVMRKNNYFKEYIYGDKKSSGSYSLICPGVASVVLGMFFIYFGLVKTNVVEIFSPAYFILLTPLVYIQFLTIKVLAQLNKKLIPKKGLLADLAAAKEN